MIIAMMQPSFMPWQGYFELILKSDTFIILDDFQFSVQSYHQRNKLFVNKGQVDWYSVPVNKRASFQCPLNATKIDESLNWRKKMWKRIQNNYSNAPYYQTLAPWLEGWILEPKESLASQNYQFIKFVCDALEYRGEFIFSSEYPSKKVRSERVAELLYISRAKEYLCAKGSFDYMLSDNIFPMAGVNTFFQDYEPIVYPQVGSKGEFIPYLSVLDILMNIGPIKTREHIINGTRKWLTWDEMKSKFS